MAYLREGKPGGWEVGKNHILNLHLYVHVGFWMMQTKKHGVLET